jgi:hypothetical protein
MIVTPLLCYDECGMLIKKVSIKKKVRFVLHFSTSGRPPEDERQERQ